MGRILLVIIIFSSLYFVTSEALAKTKSPVKTIKEYYPEQNQIVTHMKLANEIEAINNSRYHPEKMLELYGSGYRQEANQAQSPFSGRE